MTMWLQAETPVLSMEDHSAYNNCENTYMGIKFRELLENTLEMQKIRTKLESSRQLSKDKHVNKKLSEKQATKIGVCVHFF